MTTNVSQITGELSLFTDEEKKRVLPRFFKTGKGEYGEGDQFLGIAVPSIRVVARRHLDAGWESLGSLLASPWHEERMCALLIMVENCKLSRKKTWNCCHEAGEGEDLRRRCFDFYLGHTASVNNWDLVDLTAPTLVGAYLINKERDMLYTLAQSHNLWEQRIAVVSTLAFIRQNDFRDIYALGEKLLHHPHDLMRKAIGWMLRETGKRDKTALSAFLDNHAEDMPRTMLRYAIERFSDEERLYFMQRKR